ncbi:MAG: VWA domain-containing protein [Myxococcota bacterium]|nr:VWA domain-containing protein [Myxococcota bacterium]
MTASARHEVILQQRREALDLELQRFVDFGALLDRRTRRYLVGILRQRVFGEAPPLLAPTGDDADALDATYMRYFAEALDDLFEDETLLELCRAQGTVGTHVATETVRWMRRTLDEADRADPHAEERSRLGHLAGFPLDRVMAGYRGFMAEIRNWYTPREIDVDFYERAFEEVLKGPGPVDTDRVEMLVRDLLATWDARLSAKRLADQMSKLVESRDKFIDRLHARVEEHRRLRSLLSPFVDYIDRGWDLSRELWTESDLDLLREYSQLIDDEDDIRRLADLLGRMHEAQIQSEEEELSTTIETQRWVTDPTLRSEIVGVRESADLPGLLSSEAALAAEPALEDRFLQKFADQRLLTYAYADRRAVRGTRDVVHRQARTRRRTKGPFILCVDTSYSMAGDAERLAKVLSFGILRMAIEEDREAYLINFSVQVRTLDLRAVGRSVDALAAFLRMSFHGGTDVTLAFGEALRRLDEGRFRDADVLLVSDFIMLKMSARVLESVTSHRHNHDTRFHALTFHDQPSPELLRCFDTVWASSPDRPGIINQVTAQLDSIRRARP